MSIRATRIVAKASIAISALALVAQTILTVTGHHDGARGVTAVLCATTGIVSGLLYLRSTRSRS